MIRWIDALCEQCGLLASGAAPVDGQPLAERACEHQVLNPGHRVWVDNRRHEETVA